MCLWYAINTTTARAFNAVDIGLLYLQVLSTIQMYPLRWHPFLVKLAAPVSIINFDLDYVTPSCMFPWNYQEHFVMVMSVMPCIGVFALGYFQAAKNVTPMITGRPADPKVLTTLQRELKARLLSFAVIMYNLLVITTLQPFMCMDTFNEPHAEESHDAREDFAQQMLFASPSIQCWTGDHLYIVAIACCGVIVYIVGIPLVLWWLLHGARKKDAMHHAESLHSFGFLYKRYQPNRYYWELMLLLRRFAVSFCLIFLQHDPSFQAVLAVLCLAGSVVRSVCLSVCLYAHRHTFNAASTRLFSIVRHQFKKKSRIYPPQ